MLGISLKSYWDYKDKIIKDELPYFEELPPEPIKAIKRFLPAVVTNCVVAIGLIRLEKEQLLMCNYLQPIKTAK